VAAELGNQDLSSDDQKPKQNESNIGVDVLKKVPFIVNFSAANHVEDLHQHKCCEDKCKVAGCTVLHLHPRGVERFTLPVLCSSREDKTCLSIELES